MELSISSSTKEFKIEASKFLFRKVFESKLSKAEKVATARSYIEKVSRVPVPQPAALQAIDQFVEWFTSDGKWDSRYEHYCEMAAVSRSACEERGRKEGGARGQLLKVALTQEQFWDCVLDGNMIKIPPWREVKILIDSGKVRIVTVASALQAQLLPLHLMMYDACRRKDFILVGDAAPSKFSKINKDGSQSGLIYENGKVFVSGDYEAATDNFNACHSQYLVDRLAERSHRVPQNTWTELRESLVGMIRFCPSIDETEDIEAAQTSGQMMGNYCSFPLLCMMNMCTIFLTFGREKAIQMAEKNEVKINGDDIVFKTTRKGFEQWARAVETLGLVLSRGKTLVHERFWSINSTFFRSTRRIRGNGIVLVPVIRSSCLFGPPKDHRSTPLQHSRLLGRGMWGRLTDFVKGTQLRTRKKYAHAFSGQNKRAANHLSFFGGEMKADVLDQQSRAVRHAYREFHRAPALFNMSTRGQNRGDGYRSLKVSTSRGFTKREVRGLRTQSRVFQRQRDWGYLPEEEPEPIYFENVHKENIGKGWLKNFCERLFNHPETLQPNSMDKSWGKLPRILGCASGTLDGKEESLIGPAVWVDLYSQKSETKFVRGKYT
jgi:hypothetical protein